MLSSCQVNLNLCRLPVPMQTVLSTHSLILDRHLAAGPQPWVMQSPCCGSSRGLPPPTSCTSWWTCRTGCSRSTTPGSIVCLHPWQNFMFFKAWNSFEISHLPSGTTPERHACRIGQSQGTSPALDTLIMSHQLICSVAIASAPDWLQSCLAGQSAARDTPHETAQPMCCAHVLR